MLATALVGAGTGALIGHLEGGIPRSDLDEIGQTLQEGEAALVVIGEATIERAGDEATRRAKKGLTKGGNADAGERAVEACSRETDRAIDAIECFVRRVGRANRPPTGCAP